MSKMLFLPLLALAALAACNKPVPALAATSAPARTSAHSGESWELVTLERSDPPNIGARAKRAAYDMCVAAALRKMAVHPFPAVPDDFEDERTTYITNGVSSVTVTQSNAGGLDGPDFDDKGGCKVTLKTGRSKVVHVAHALSSIPDDYDDKRVTRITKGVSTVLVEDRWEQDLDGPTVEGNCKITLASGHDHLVTISHRGMTTTILGGVVVDTSPIPPWPPSTPRGKSTAQYTVARTIKGVQLRWLPPNFWLLNKNDRLDAREMCV